MAITPPTNDDLAEIARRYRLGLDAGDVEWFRQSRQVGVREMIANTAPFDVTGHPATSVPVGLTDGLPVGMMIVGRHLADGTCLRGPSRTPSAASPPRPGTDWPAMPSVQPADWVSARPPA